jgi:hypothetical protein
MSESDSEPDDVTEMMEYLAGLNRTAYIRPMFELIDDLHSSRIGRVAARWPIPFDGDEILQ